MTTRLALQIQLLIVATPAVGQEVSVDTEPAAAKTTRQQDLSLFVQSGGPLRINSNNGSAAIHGLMYRRAFSGSPQTFWKLGVGAGTLDYSGLRYMQPPGRSDTSIDIFYTHHERVLQATGGLETERQLWRGLYLTAGLELQAGGSGGYVDSMSQTTYYNNTQPQIVTSPPHRFADTRQYFGAGIGALGIRGYSQRFTAGLEVFTGARAAIRSQALTNANLPDVIRRYSIFDFSAGGFGTRLSVGYRF